MFSQTKKPASRKVHRFIAVLLTAVLMLSCAACGGDANSNEPSLASSSNISNEPSSISNDNISNENGTLSGGNHGKVIAVYASNNHSAFITEDGRLWTVGGNGYGQLGRTSGAYSNDIVAMMDNVLQAALGEKHTAALKNDGSLWVWGDNYYGQLGNGKSGGEIDAYDEDIDSETPIKVLDEVVFIAANEYQTFAVKSDGSLWAWGYSGKIITSNVDDIVTEPAKVMDDVISVDIGGDITNGRFHAAVIKTDGSLWTWGNNQYYQLGDGTNNNKGAMETTKVAEDVAMVSIGRTHTLIIKNDGTLWGWGSNSDYILGDLKDDYVGVMTVITEPKFIMDNVVSVAASTDRTLVVKTDGSLWGCGKNDKQELGIDNGKGDTLVEALREVITIDNVAFIAAGKSYTFAIKNDGTLWGFGRNDRPLGLGSNLGNAILPTQIEF